MCPFIRRFIVVGCMIVAGPALGQAYPARPVRMIVPFSPGGTADIVARIAGQKLSELWEKQVIVENRPGADGNIGLEMVSKASPDGYTLVMTNNGQFAMNPHLQAKLPYRPFEDFTPIAVVADTPHVLVAYAAGPISSIGELIAAAKARPGYITYSSPGSGSPGHVTAEWFASEAGIKLLHVPYKGGGPAAAAVASGEVMTGMVGAPAALAFLKAGRVKVLGVTGTQRLASAPDWPTIAESGVPGINTRMWVGVFAPAGTPRAVIDKVSADLTRAMRLPDVQQRLVAVGGEPVAASTPEETLARLKRDFAQYQMVIQTSNIRVE